MADYSITIELAAFALLGGILPPLVWLWFWLKEDAKRPEPRGLIIFTFIAGAASALVAGFAQEFLAPFFQGAQGVEDIIFATGGITMIFAFAAIEEFVKYGAAHLVGLKSRFFDEPIDAMIYLITAGLGFAALENTLYLASILVADLDAVATLNIPLRFIGATSLHVLASASVGVAIAFSYYKRKKHKMFYLFIGLLTATLLHALFNLFIINTQTIMDLLGVFAFFWAIAIVLILLFEKVKRLVPHPHD